MNIIKVSIYLCIYSYLSYIYIDLIVCFALGKEKLIIIDPYYVANTVLGLCTYWCYLVFK